MGRLLAPSVRVARRGRSRPPTREEAVALVVSALKALEEAGVPVEVGNVDDGRALVLLRGRWR